MSEWSICRSLLHSFQTSIKFLRLITSDNVENTWKVSDLNACQLRKEKQNVDLNCYLILFLFLHAISMTSFEEKKTGRCFQSKCEFFLISWCAIWTYRSKLR